MTTSFLQLQGLYPKEKLSIKLFFVSILFGLIILFSATLTGYIIVLSVLASVLTGFSGIFIFMNSYHSNKYTKWLFILLLYFLVVGISYGDFNPNFRGETGNFMWIVTQDLRYVMYFIMGSILATKKYMPYFHQIMRFLGYLSIIGAVLGLYFFDFNMQHIDDRSSTWNFSYYCWWISSACFIYWGYYVIIIKKEKGIGYGVLLSYFILGILFLKRVALINVILIVLIANLISNKYIFKSLFKIILFVISIIIINVIFTNIFHITAIEKILTLLLDRFDVVDDLSTIDRVLEWDVYKTQASLKQFILGNGIGHYPEIEINKNFFIERLNALHIGFYNIIFKGGIVYVLFYIFIYKIILMKISRIKTFEKTELVYFGVAISALISMLYEGSWTYTLVPFCISAPIFYIALNNDQ